jgi:hypothetical protein
MSRYSGFGLVIASKNFLFCLYRNRTVTFRHKFILPFRITLVNGVIDI